MKQIQNLERATTSEMIENLDQFRNKKGKFSIWKFLINPKTWGYFLLVIERILDLIRLIINNPITQDIYQEQEAKILEIRSRQEENKDK